ncbi:hypothetical protein ACWC3X_43630 [Streptomyces populi]
MLLFVARIGSWGRSAENESRMTKSHGRKSRARNKSRARGAAFASANAGALHQHSSGPSAADLQLVDPARWGVGTAPDMRTAAGLIGACIERCALCRESLTAKLLDDENLVALAMTAAAVYNLRVIHEPDADSPAVRPLQIFYLLVKHARLHAGDARLLTETVERMPRADRAALLEAALELWTSYGPQGLGLMRGPGACRPSPPSAIRPRRDPALKQMSTTRAETDPADQAAVRRAGQHQVLHHFACQSDPAARSPAVHDPPSQQGDPDPHKREHRGHRPERGPLPRRARL